jgi:hypothetical protein
MNIYRIEIIFGFSSCIAALIGLIRFRKILTAYQPFIFFTWLACMNDLLSMAMIKWYKSNATNGNIYVLLESLLLIWLFKNWGVLQKRAWHLSALVGVLLGLWIYDNFWLNKLETVNSLFRICYSFVLIFLSIDQINRLIIQERGNILRNAKFLICISIIVFYTYKAIIEVFYLIRLEASDEFYTNIFTIMIFVNFFVNLIYALAALWIPTKQKFTLRF